MGAWSDTPPEAPGLYWFFGELEWGSMGGHFSGSVPFRPRLDLVKVDGVGDQLFAASVGRFVSLEKFNPEERWGTGWWGLWADASHPDLPQVEPPPLLERE